MQIFSELASKFSCRVKSIGRRGMSVHRYLKWSMFRSNFFVHATSEWTAFSGTDPKQFMKELSDRKERQMRETLLVAEFDSESLRAAIPAEPECGNVEPSDHGAAQSLRRIRIHVPIRSVSKLQRYRPTGGHLHLVFSQRSDVLAYDRKHNRLRLRVPTNK